MNALECLKENCSGTARKVVSEVWFDYGMPIKHLSAFVSGENGLGLSFCEEHVANGAAFIAQTLLVKANQEGAIFIPSRWWVQFQDETIIGGFIFPPQSLN